MKHELAHVMEQAARERLLRLGDLEALGQRLAADRGAERMPPELEHREISAFHDPKTEKTERLSTSWATVLNPRNASARCTSATPPGIE